MMIIIIIMCFCHLLFFVFFDSVELVIIEVFKTNKSAQIVSCDVQTCHMTISHVL